MSAPVTAIVVAGGTGQRLGVLGGKQLLQLAGRPVLGWTVDAMAGSGVVDAIVVVCHPERVDEYREAVTAGVATELPLSFVAGGETRQSSVAAGLIAVASDDTVVVVHDGARPFVAVNLLTEAVRVVREGEADGAVAAYPVSDTIKTVHGVTVESTPDRSRLWAVQTPQVFLARTLRSAVAAASADGFVGTDDATLVERAGGRVVVVEGPRDNIKITHAEDVLVAEAILAFRSTEQDGS